MTEEAYKQIPLTNGGYVTVDSHNYERLISMCSGWFTISGGLTAGNIKNDEGKWERIYMHRAIFNFPEEGLTVRYLDGDKRNNIEKNMKLCKRNEVQMNIKPFMNKSSSYKGVSRNRDKWEARLGINGNMKRLGMFTDEIAAANAYNYYAEQIYGEHFIKNEAPFMEKEEWEQYRITRKEAKVIEEIRCSHCDAVISPLAKKQRINKCCGSCNTAQNRAARKLEKEAQRINKPKKPPKHAIKLYEVEINGVKHNARECMACNEIKPLYEFKFYNDRPYSRCKSCEKVYRDSRKQITKELCAKRYLSKKNEIAEKNKQWRLNNQESVKEYKKVRKKNDRARKKLLDCYLTKEQQRQILNQFNNRCALTDSKDFHMEHFIPLAWGHGGTYVGNIYPLDSVLNINKKDLNPFEWAKDQGINKERWKFLISYLAAANGLNSEEFRDFVYWCEANKRNIAQIREDNKPSLEIYLCEKRK